MTRTQVTLVEYGEGIEIAGDEGFVNAINKEADLWKNRLGLQSSPFEATSMGARVRLRTRDVAGFIRVGDYQIEVAPKFLDPSSVVSGEWRVALWRILELVENDSLFSQSYLLAENQDRSLIDVMARSFLASLRFGSSQGLPRGYREQSGKQVVLRGRVDTSRFGDLVLRPWELSCVFEDYVEDIPINRLFRWTARELARDVYSLQLHRSLIEFDSLLSHVEATPPSPEEVDRLRLPVQYRDLVPALDIARLIMQSKGLSHGIQSHEVSGFLWKSSDVYEAFVFRLMRLTAGRRLGLRVSKDSFDLASPVRPPASRSFRTEPDVQVRDGHGQSILILDAKYKSWQGGVPGPADRYQVIVGGWITGCDRVALAYPSPGGRRREAMRWELNGPSSPTLLAAIFVNLSAMSNPRGERQLSDELLEDLEEVLNL